MAEGLAPLTEHDSTLRDDLSHLQDAGRSRGAAVIDGLAGEEAAKMPVLWNVVRISWTEIDALRAQLRTLNTAPRPRGTYAPDAPEAGGATTRELMPRMGHSSARAALIHQHLVNGRAHAIAAHVDERNRQVWPGESGDASGT